MTDDLLYSLTIQTFLYNKEEQIIHLNCMLFFVLLCLFHKYLLIASFTIAWYVMYAIKKILIMVYSLIRNLIVAHYSAAVSPDPCFVYNSPSLYVSMVINWFHLNPVLYNLWNRPKLKFKFKLQTWCCTSLGEPHWWGEGGKREVTTINGPSVILMG